MRVAGDWVHAEVVGPTAAAGGNYDPQVLLGPNGHRFERCQLLAHPGRRDATG